MLLFLSVSSVSSSFIFAYLIIRQAHARPGYIVGGLSGLGRVPYQVEDKMECQLVLDWC